ncbi:MAG: hypothetical protein PHH57_06350, partial [Candidatus Omnitrophica bacterium]|nr:hypothetical protein [Candidatus Omnitrophota bacterium]
VSKGWVHGYEKKILRSGKLANVADSTVPAWDGELRERVDRMRAAVWVERIMDRSRRADELAWVVV